MTTEIFNEDDATRLEEFLKSNNISIDFLNCGLWNNFYELKEKLKEKPTQSEYQLIGNFSYHNHNFFELLTKSEYQLLRYRNVGRGKLNRLNDFLAKYNCYIGMFQGYTPATFKIVVSNNISIEDLTEPEKTISLLLLNNLVKTTEDDLELAKEIRRIFSVIK